MKNFLITFISGFLLLLSCSKIDDNVNLPENFKSNNKDTLFSIDKKLVEKYLSIKISNNSDLVVKSILPITKGNYTLLYLVNYENNKGWIIISGDKRTQPELSYSDVGNININEIVPSMNNWLNNLCNDIYQLKLSSSTDTTSKYFMFWSKVDEVGTFKKHVSNNLTKGGGDEEEGYWSLVYIESEQLSPLNIVDHLIYTKWGQSYPWNVCVPYNINFTDRCKAGCVAVAGAQIAYYLHYHLGVPKYSYSTGYFNGWSDGDSYSYSSYFGDSDSTVWDQMPYYSSYQTSGSDKVAILLGYIGSCANMKWAASKSGAMTNDLSNYFTPRDVSYSYVNYNYSTVRANLNNQLPVIVEAFSNRDNFLFWSWVNNGHAWIIDGYEDSRMYYKFYYQWFAKDDPLPEVDLTDTEHIRTEEEIVVTNYLLMNWGWNGVYDDGRYIYNGDWQPENKNYQYERKILCNFSKAY